MLVKSTFWTELSSLRKLFIQKQSKDILSLQAKVHLGFLLLIMYCSASHRNQIMHLDLQLAFCLLNYMPSWHFFVYSYACVHVYRGTHVCLACVCIHVEITFNLQLFFFRSHASCFVRQGLLLIVDFAEYRGCLQQAPNILLFPPSSNGISSTYHHTKLFRWMLGLKTDLFVHGASTSSRVLSFQLLYIKNWKQNISLQYRYLGLLVVMKSYNQLDSVRM